MPRTFLTASTPSARVTGRRAVVRLLRQQGATRAQAHAIASAARRAGPGVTVEPTVAPGTYVALVAVVA